MSCEFQYRDRPKVMDLTQGDKVKWHPQKPPVTIQNVNERKKEKGTITIIATAECRGPEGGRVLLETTSTGRNRATVGHKRYTPAYTVRELTLIE